MLVLSRMPQQLIIMDLSGLVPMIKSDPENLEQILSQEIAICPTEINYTDGKVRIGIDAHSSILVNRKEVHEKIKMTGKKRNS